MLELLVARHLEGPHLTALGVDAPEDVFDRAVLAAGVDRLEHDEQAAAALRVQALLQRPDALAIAVDQVGDVGLGLELGALAGVDLSQLDPLADLDPMTREGQVHPSDATGMTSVRMRRWRASGMSSAASAG